MKTIYVKKKYYDTLRLNDFPNAGPNPCIEGLRQTIYGRNAFLIKCGVYVYHVDEATYKQAETLQ